jgi:hypothetical protein
LVLGRKQLTPAFSVFWNSSIVILRGFGLRMANASAISEDLGAHIAMIVVRKLES